MPIDYAKCFISGWGRNENLQRPDTLQWSKVKTYRDCKSKYPGINVNQICAGNADKYHKNTCRGDSGGPLMCESFGTVFLVGVASYGLVNCTDTKNYPSVFTRVYKYTKWIEENKGKSVKSTTKPKGLCMWRIYCPDLLY